MMKREIFKVEGNKIVRLRKYCPKCGEGVFLADHGDRFSCGHCGYTEFKPGVPRIKAPKQEKKPEVKQPEKKTEKPAAAPAKPSDKPKTDAPPGKPGKDHAPHKPSH